MPYCFVPGCNTGYPCTVKENKSLGKKNCSLFRAPKDELLLEKWRRAVPRADKLLTVKHSVCELHFMEEEVERYYTHVLPDGNIHKLERGRPILKKNSVPSIFPNLPAYLSSNTKKRKPPKARNVVTQKKQKVAESMSTEPNNKVPECSSTNEDEQSFYNFVQNINVIVKPDSFWSGHATTEFIVFAKWNNEYAAEKRVILTKDLNVKVFLRNKEILLNCLVPSDVENISALLKKVDKLVHCHQIDRNMPDCLGYVNESIQLAGRPRIVCENCFKKKPMLCKTLKAKRKQLQQYQFKKSAFNVYRRNLRMKEKIKILKNKIQNFQKRCALANTKIVEEAISNFTPAQQEAIKASIAASKLKDKRGMRYMTQWIYHCLLLRIKSKKAYNHLRNHQILALPSIATLCRYIRKVKGVYGFQSHVFQCLTQKSASMDPSDRRGNLLLDEMKVSSAVTFNPKTMEVEGFTDLGKYTPHHQKCKKGDHALVMMFQQGCHRASLWAKWAFPDGNFDTVEKLMKLFNSNNFLCSDHFSPDSFIEHDSLHLHRHALPIGALPPQHLHPEFRTSVELSLLTSRNLTVNNSDITTQQKQNLTNIVSSPSMSPLQADSVPVDNSTTLQSSFVPPTTRRKLVFEDKCQKDLDCTPNIQKCSTVTDQTTTLFSTSPLLDTPKKFSKEIQCQENFICSTPNTQSHSALAYQTPPSSCSVSPLLSTPKRPNLKRKCLEYVSSSASKVSRRSHSVSRVPKRQRQPTTKKKVRRQLLRRINETRAANLTPNKYVLYSECRKYARQLSNLKSQCNRMKTYEKLKSLSNNRSLDKILKNMSPAAAILLKSQLRCTNRKAKGRRWTMDEKILALSIYKRSPTCYSLLSKMLVLPSPSSLKKLLSTIPLTTGICTNLFSSLQKSVHKMKKGSETSILMFDEVAIRRHVMYNRRRDMIMGYEDHGTYGRKQALANRALVFMLVGLKQNFKHPLAYYLSSGGVSTTRLKLMLKDVLGALSEIGMDVVGTVCDMGTNNVSAMTGLKENEYDCFFKHKGQQIAVVYDVPHLLKAFRNMFRKHDIEFDMDSNIQGFKRRGVAKWDHLAAVYDRDQKTRYQLVRKLTESHMKPNTKQSMKVKLAAQVLSHTMAAACYALDGSENCFSGAAETAELVKNIDTLFDSLNGHCSGKKKGKKFRGPVSRKSGHLNLWQKQKQLLKRMTFKTPTGRQPPSKNGWVSTISGMTHIWKAVESRGFNYLETRRVSQDPLENFFGKLRGLCGSNSNPNVEQFEGAFKSCLLTGLTNEDLKQGNCEADNFKFLENLHTLIVSSRQTDLSDNRNSEESNCEDIDEINPIEVTQNREDVSNLSLSYVTGFVKRELFHKCSAAAECETCNEDMSSNVLEPQNRFIFHKEYSAEMENLKYPSFSFSQSVDGCTEITCCFLDRHSEASNVKKQIFARMQGQMDVLFQWMHCALHKEQSINLIMESVFFIVVKAWCLKVNEKVRREEHVKALRKKISILKGC